MFVLLARDPLAPELVRQWAYQRWDRDEQRDLLKCAEALDCALAMEQWRITNPPEKKP